MNIEKLKNWTFLFRPMNISLLHISCHSAPIFLKKRRSAESLLYCPATHTGSVIFSSVLYYPSPEFIVFYLFNSIATACGCEWGEGASLDIGDWLCYFCAGAAAALFLLCYSPASTPAQGMLRRSIRPSGREQWMSQAGFHPARCMSSCLMPDHVHYLTSSEEQYLSLH